MNRVALLFLLLLALPFLSFTPYSHVDATSTMAPSANTSGLGPSVDLSYQVLNKTFHDAVSEVVFPTDWTSEHISALYPYLLENDEKRWEYILYGSDDGQATFYVNFKILSPYTSVSKCYYNFSGSCVGGDAETFTVKVQLFHTAGYTQATHNTEDTYTSGSLSIDETYVNDGYIHGRFGFDAIDNEAAMDNYYLFVEQLCFEYNTVTETRRSSYEVTGGTLRYTVDWDTWDYNVNTTLTVPSAWTFQDVNPDCGVTSDEFECLVPKTYEAIYTASVTGIANWAPYWSTSFENSETFGGLGGAYNFDEQDQEYEVVLDGATSLYVNSTGSAATFFDINKRLPDGNYTFVFSIYRIENSPTFQLRYYDGAWRTAETLSLTTGAWTTCLVAIEPIGVSGVRNWQFYIYNDIRFYIDSFYIYQSNVETGQTITGTCYQIHPNGYTPFGNFTMEYQCTSWYASWTELVTDTDGSWSVSTSPWSPSAGTEYFETRNPDDTTNDVTSDPITYPFSVDVSTTLWMVFKRGTGQLIPWGTFICYVDDEIRPEPYAEITGTTTTGTSYTVNITLIDDFGQLLYQNTSYPVENSGNTFLRETLNVYILNLANQRNRLQYAIVTRNGETWTSPDIGVYGSFPYLVYGSVAGITYTVDWYRAHDDHLTDSYTWTVYTADVTAYSGYDPPPESPGGVGGDLPDFWKIMIIFIAVMAVVSLIATLLKGGKKEVVVARSIPQPGEGEDLDFSKLTPEDEVQAEIRAQLALRRKIEEERKGGES